MPNVERGVAEIIRRCHAGLDTQTLLDELLRLLPRVIPFDQALIATTDPGTLLYTGGVLAERSHATQLPGFLANEYLDEDVMKYADLAAGPQRVGILQRSTKGNPAVSPRYRKLLRPLGLGDELRAAFVAGGSCWGVSCLARAHGSVGFSEHDARVMARLGPHVAEGIRKSLLLTEASSPSSETDGPGVLVLGEDLSVIATTPAAERLLDEIQVERAARLRGLPASVVNVVAILRALDGSADRPSVQPRVRVRSRSGQWLALHASYLGDEEAERRIAVVIEPAQRGDLPVLILQAHGLTSKESEVARLLLLGSSTKDISAALHISEHTVQDHFKSIFAKVGVGNRRELVARILSDHSSGT